MGDVISLEEYRKRRSGETGKRVAVAPGTGTGTGKAVSKVPDPPLKQPAERTPEATDDQPKK